jgi:hypothetical protein
MLLFKNLILKTDDYLLHPVYVPKSETVTYPREKALIKRIIRY